MPHSRLPVGWVRVSGQRHGDSDIKDVLTSLAKMPKDFGLPLEFAETLLIRLQDEDPRIVLAWLVGELRLLDHHLADLLGRLH